MPEWNTAIFLSYFVNLAIKSQTLQSLFHFKYDTGRSLPPTFWPKRQTPPETSLNVQKTALLGIREHSNVFTTTSNQVSQGVVLHQFFLR